MEQTKGLSCQIPESLHARVTAERVAANQSLSEYITGLLTNYYENGGKKDMAQTVRTCSSGSRTIWPTRMSARAGK